MKWSDFTRELISITRLYAALEKVAVCCGKVTVQQSLVLEALRESARDMSALADIAGASVSAMTRLVDGLERRGLVARERTKEDRRRVVATLTPEGKVEADRLHGLTDAAAMAVLSKIPETERPRVLASLRQVREGMEATYEVVKGAGVEAP